MVNKPRTARVLASLVASMTIGAIVLLAVDSRPVPAGAFSLASYSRLNPIEDIINTPVAIQNDRWNTIEVFYSKTIGGDLEQLSSISGLKSTADLNFHFAIYNGRAGNDGQIESTERWKRQWSCTPTGNWHGLGSTIRVCVIANGRSVPPTDCQRKRTAALVEELSHMFNVPTTSISFPSNWQL
jgi:hypothetical protein